MKPEKLPEIRGEVVPSGATGKRPLIVVLHGNRGGRDTVGSVVEVAKKTRRKADAWVPIMPHSRKVSFVGLNETARALKAKLDGHWCDEYDELVIIGHSTGGALARALFVAGAQGGSAWAHKMLENGRIVMLGGMNRGWRISHHLSLKSAILWTAGAMVGHFLALFGARLGLFDLRRGSLFLTKMRFAWLELAKEARTPLTVQLLGTIDDMVGPQDAIDVVTGASFYYLDVPHSGHLSVLEMGGADPENCGRAERLRIALADECVIQENRVLPWGLESYDSADSAERSEQDGADHVVFVIHGIRDEGYWTDKIARHIWKRCEPAKRKRLERVTASYGYLGMGPFLFPWVRRRKVEWLADQVLEAKARFPGARLSYVGHSNGTYLLASALETYREIEGFRFDRVVFAGSVVSRDYDWSPVTKGDPATSVLNITATGDWVVALFPQLFELVPIQDLGSAGHNGFDQGPPRITNLQYAKGGHGAGIDEAFWNHIADFVLADDKGGPGGEDRTEEQRPGVKDLDELGEALRHLKSFTPLPFWLLLVSILFVLVPATIVRLPALIALGWCWLLAEWWWLSNAVQSVEHLADPLSVGGGTLVALALGVGVLGGGVAFLRTRKAVRSGGKRKPLRAAIVSALVLMLLGASLLLPAVLVGVLALVAVAGLSVAFGKLRAALPLIVVLVVLEVIVLWPIGFVGPSLAEPATWGTGLVVLYFVALVSVLKRL